MHTCFSKLRLPTRGALFLAAITISAGCATGSTFRSGVGDRHLDGPPYYAGSASGSAMMPIAHFPAAFQRGASQPPMFEPGGGDGTAIAALLADMNAFLDSLGATVRVEAPAARGETAPDVRFGCQTDAAGDCDAGTENGGVVTPRGATMLLAVGRPSKAWVESARSRLEAAGAGSAVLITLEIGQYWTRQVNWRGDKQVELGSGYAQDVPWLTSLDAPVQVLQLTGVRVDRDGRAIRIGAEGLLARRTNLVLSGFGVQSLLSDDDLARVRSLRREDLPGRPLVWQVALRTLVGELTGAVLSDR